jgi:hypothetical protein
MSNLHLTTVATHSEGYLPVLEKQAEEKGIKLVKLGFGKKYIGHHMKDLEMIEFLKTIPSGDFIIFVDGFDSLMLSDIEEIVSKFNEKKAKLVLSIENIGILSFIHSAVFEKILGKYINTGLYMGERDFLYDFLTTMYSKENYSRQSNQKTWGSHLNKLQQQGKLENIVLDEKSDIFLNHSFSTSNRPQLKNKRIVLEEKHRPCFIQGNGKEDMGYIIKETGHDKYNEHKGDFFWEKIKYNTKAIFRVYNPILTFYIYLVFLLIGLVVFLYMRYRRKQKDKYFYMG